MFQAPLYYLSSKQRDWSFLFYAAIKERLPHSDDVLFVFYDFETTQDTKFSETANKRIPILACVQHFCSVCEMQGDIEMDCARCGRRRHSLYDDPVGNLLSYLCEPRRWCNKVVAIAHNAKAFDSQFILKRAIFLKWNPQILSGLKMISMKIQHIHFPDPTCPCLYVNYLRHLGFR